MYILQGLRDLDSANLFEFWKLLFILINYKITTKQSELACADLGCPTERSEGGRACIDKASRQSGSACALWASKSRRRPFCTFGNGTAAHPSASACGL